MRVTLRRISGSKALGAFALTVEEVCPGCGLHSDHVEALERHITRCPLGAVKYFMHRGLLAYLVARLLRQAGAAKTDIVFEVSNLRQGDKTRPGDVVWLNFLGPGQHLLIDVSITGVYRDAVSEARMSAAFRGSLPRLWKMPSWMRTSDPLALLFPSAMGVVIDL